MRKSAFTMFIVILALASVAAFAAQKPAAPPTQTLQGQVASIDEKAMAAANAPAA